MSPFVLASLGAGMTSRGMASQGIGVLPAPLSGDIPMYPCLIIVSREEPGLLRALMGLYGHESGVQIRYDRRHGLPWSGPGETPARRSPPSLDTDLKDHGFIVIPRPSMGWLSR